MAFLTEIPNTRVLYYPAKIFKEFNETFAKNIELMIRGNIEAPEAGKTIAKDRNDALLKRAGR